LWAVLDASAAIELLLQTAPGAQLTKLVADFRLAVPAHFEIEVLSALGRLARQRVVQDVEVARYLDLLESSPFERFPSHLLLRDAWALRANVALRDAPYIVLARRLACPLITADARLSRAPGLGVPVITASS
jgi:predicted nucleic acid-binding protein